jgi:hypothetical protein
MVLSLWEVNSEEGGGDFFILCCVLRMSPLWLIRTQPGSFRNSLEAEQAETRLTFDLKDPV